MTGPYVLVVGATGMLGRPVVERLIADQFPVRLLVRDRAKAAASFGDRVDYVEGDVGDSAAVDRAVQGVDAVHVSLRGTTLASIEAVEVGGTGAIARAAQRHKVSRLTYLSGAGIQDGNPRLLPVRIKRAAERAIGDSGVRATIMRPTHFMESLDWFVRGSKAEVLGSQPNRFHYLAADDYARQVARLLSSPALDVAELTLLGPQAYTMREALEVYIARARPDVKIGQAPLGIVKLVAAVTRNPKLQLVAQLFEAFRHLPETGDSEAAERLVGKATTTLETWCDARRAA